MADRTQKGRHFIYYAIIAVIITFLFFILLSIYLKKNDPVDQGKMINQSAWESSFFERNLPVPRSGPREGYWGSRIGPKIHHPILGWHEPGLSVPGLLEIDKNGFQHYKNSSIRKSRVLILGGSVAFGAYASSIQKTYFYIAGKTLEGHSTPADLTIIAAGAWKSMQELSALKLYGESLKPDLVIFLNGLNDLTNGATSKTLYGQKTETRDGSEWTVLYHDHDYQQRVDDYLSNMEYAAEITARFGSKTLIILQPSLLERIKRTPIEERILKMSMEPHKSSALIMQCYESMRQRLNDMARPQDLYFLDCSRVFNAEPRSIFSDLWHFSDIGHKTLGKALGQKIASILNQRFPKDQSTKVHPD